MSLANQIPQESVTSKKVFTMFDQKAEAFLDPFFARNEGVAIRMLESSLRDPNAPMAQYPGDFHLMMIGTWDEFSGKITPLESPVHLGSALQYMPQPEAPKTPQMPEVMQLAQDLAPNGDMRGEN